MPIYQPEPYNDESESVERKPFQSLALRLLASSPVNLYCSRSILESESEELTAEGFDVRRLDAAKWMTVDDMHDDLQRVLCFPDYYGRNLNALAECIRDDLPIEDGGGLALVLADYDDFAKRDAVLASALLNYLARGSRQTQLFAKTLLTLVHTKDPDIDFGQLGAVRAWWNEKEFVRSRRGAK